jgi:exodeoxyribonuclease VII large subunit
MSQIPLFQPNPLSVSEVNAYLRQILEGDTLLQDLWVSGEISNFSRPASGHLYFTLKDTSAALRCVMWRNAAQRMRLPLRDGAAVEVHGAVNVYEASGQVQLYVDIIRPAGEGILFQEFMRLKAQLEAEGLFDPSRKREIPAFPRRIGIVTSPTGAALQDMLNTLRRRYPLVTVILAPTPVQGDEAPAGIIAALQQLNQPRDGTPAPDVILVARGGGSLEDLWAFNDEDVVRAIAASAAPVITGIGHETDFTLADFAADLRAPTPTASAELAVPDQLELRAAHQALSVRLEAAFLSQVSTSRQKRSLLANRLQRYSPINQIRSYRQSLDDFSRRGQLAVDHSLELKTLRLNSLETRLTSLNPLAVLQRGYAILSRPAAGDGKIEIIRSAHQVTDGDALQAQVADGTFAVKVMKES